MLRGCSGTGVELQRTLSPIVPHCLPKTVGNIVQVDLPCRITARFDKPNAVLAQGEDIEEAVVTQQWEQRLQMEAFAHHRQFLYAEGQAIDGQPALHCEHGQSISLMHPELVIVEQLVAARQHLLCLGRPHPCCNQSTFCLMQQVLEADGVLLSLRRGTVARHEEGYLQPLLCDHHPLDCFSVD
jgi:hypothetical protein